MFSLRHLRRVLALPQSTHRQQQQRFINKPLLSRVVESIRSMSSSQEKLNNSVAPASTNGTAEEGGAGAVAVAVAAAGTSNGTSEVRSGDLVSFLELVGNLKHLKRTGWVLRDVNDCETVAGHMYRMSLMTFLLTGAEGLDRIKCMEMALVHDLAESLVGDITPYCGVSKKDKEVLEMEAINKICGLIKPRGDHILQLFYEYEKAESPEARFVKDLDRLDMVLQALEYEKRDDCPGTHQEFFDSTEGKFNHPMVKKLVEEINEQRIEMIKNRQAKNQEKQN